MADALVPVSLQTPVPTQLPDSIRLRMRLQVRGVVQGVGFRPFIHQLATRYALDGFVRNDCAGVTIEFEGNAPALDACHRELISAPPPLAHIDDVTAIQLPPTGERGFAILHSDDSDAANTLVSPDIAICDDCLRELFDPSDRRYRYPFINCTNCGPRFTIIRDLPYDRPLTTMADFHLCPQCSQEYSDPTNRRFHAQPNACPDCGPQLEFSWLGQQVPARLARRFHTKHEHSLGEEALQQAQWMLAFGGIVAVKGIGGFHLACDATNEQAVKRLRQRKQRGDKPFAIMARDLASALRVAHASADEIALLTSRQRPVVLLRKRADSPLSKQIAPGNRTIGIMLPYSPLHHLLFATSPDCEVEPPPWLVMTSANHSGEPIVTDNQVARESLTDLADAVLTHNRTIHVPCDDSVVRLFETKPFFIRRSRGYAPLPIPLPQPVPPMLAVGGELKNAFCLASGQQAFMSQHIGDMQTLETQQAFIQALSHMSRLFDIEPRLVVGDLHPGYLSTQWAEAWAQTSGTKLIRVQHHHAHIASLMAEHGIAGDQPIIGFCFDGTGYGTDKAIWGGEVLVADYGQFERVAHLAYIPLPGGDAAIHKPYRMALAALWTAGIEWDPALPCVAAASPTELALLRRQLETNLNCVPTSSMGRLFDIVASISGICQIATYEAQAAIELEAASRNDDSSYHFPLPPSGTPAIDTSPLLQSVVADVLNNTPARVIAARFQNAVAHLILELSLRLRADRGLNQVALSGGVFQNTALLREATNRLRDAGFDVLIHSAVPCNDGGLALGQVMVALQQESELCA